MKFTPVVVIFLLYKSNYDNNPPNMGSASTVPVLVMQPYICPNPFPWRREGLDATYCIVLTLSFSIPGGIIRNSIGQWAESFHWLMELIEIIMFCGSRSSGG